MRDAFVRTNRRVIAMMFVCPSVCLSVCRSGTGVHCDYTVHVRAVLSYGWIVRCSGHPDTKACPPITPSRLSTFPPVREVWYGLQTRRDISRTVEDNRKSYTYVGSIGTTTDDLE